MRHAARLILVLGLLAGCDGLKGWPWGPSARPGEANEPAPVQIDPLPVQQARAYPETLTGLFASLADFEDAPGGARGYAQAGDFVLDPPGRGGRVRFVVNVTRTGVGALEATLPPKTALVFTIPHVHDFTGYRLLSMALYSRSLRDDLRVTVVTDGASWTSHRTLVRPGWNNVLIDIQRLQAVPGFDISSVRSIRIAFADAAGGVWINLDDVMIIDNARQIRPTPPGVILHKSGLNYRLGLPGRDRPIALNQAGDGLWRLGEFQPQVRLAGPGRTLAPDGENLELMGRRRVGHVRVLEHNAVRLRLADTWYFPTRAGEWASLAVRRIHWEHTVYADGRWVTQITLNNAGGRQIGSLGMLLPAPAAWAGGELRDRLTVADFGRTVGRWQYLIPSPGPVGKTVAANYLRPARLVRRIAAEGVFAPGDAGRDGFDESQGCFFLGAKAGHCRFTVTPPPEGLASPAFLVAGQWTGPVHVSSEGLAIRPVVRRADGSALFVLPGLIRRPTAVEVRGPVASLAGR